MGNHLGFDAAVEFIISLSQARAEQNQTKAPI